MDLPHGRAQVAVLNFPVILTGSYLARIFDLMVPELFLNRIK
jgi:hypothetical protein